MSDWRKSLWIAALQLLIVSALGGKLLLDRFTLPRVWVRTAAYDPDDPFRGRYLSVRLQVNAERVYRGEGIPSGNGGNSFAQMRPIYLTGEHGELFANPAPSWTGLEVTRWNTPSGPVTVLLQPVAYFLPETASDPTRRPRGEELWMEVTVPRKGLPRPIRLAIKRGDSFTPLDYK